MVWMRAHFGMYLGSMEVCEFVKLCEGMTGKIINFGERQPTYRSVWHHQKAWTRSPQWHDIQWPYTYTYLVEKPGLFKREVVELQVPGCLQIHPLLGLNTSD